MATTLSLSGTGITVDQSSLAQNSNATGAAAESLDVAADNDTSITAIQTGDTTFIPNPFETYLFNQGITTPMQVALSGFTGAAGDTGADLLTISGAYLDLAFTDAYGNLLGSAANLAADGNWSGLYTIDGLKIFLYTDTVNNNIVLGRAGSEGSTPPATDDVPNSSGAIIFAAYLEETATGAKVWMVLNAPISHPDGGATFAEHDDAVDLTDHLWATASVEASFDFAGAPPGQNVFMMFRAGETDVGVVVSGMDPDQGGTGQNKSDTVNISNASKSGGPTLGTNNQGVDAGEGMVLTFVTTPDPRYTVDPDGPDTLTQTEAGNENNILFGGLFAATGATFEIAQTTPPNQQTITLKAFTTAKETGTGFADGLLDGNGNPVDSNTQPADEMEYIESVTVYAADGTTVLDTFTATGAGSNASNSITATFTTSDGGNDRFVEITGVLSGSFIKYTVTGTHNRISIQNTGTGNDTFDIGSLKLPNLQPVPQEIGSAMGFEDDGPRAQGSQTGIVDEDGLTGQSTGIAGGTDDVAGTDITAGGLLKDIFTTGTDGLSTFSLSNDAAQLALIKAIDPANANAVVPLFSKGVALAYAVTASGGAGTPLDTLTAYADADGGGNGDLDAGEREVFTLVLSNLADYNNAAYTFTLKDQLDHPSQDEQAGLDNTENDLVLQLGSILKIADNDTDFTFAPSGALAITVDDDTPIRTGVVGGGTVDEDGVLEGAANAGPGDGIAGGTGDVSGESVVVNGNVSTLFQSGADEALTYSLTATGLPVLTSAGVAVTYLVTTDAGVDTLTASAGVGNTVFTLALTKATGAYTFTLVDQLDHADANAENDLSLLLGAAISAKDFDGDSVAALAADFVITVDDDSPIRTGVVGGGTVDEDRVREAGNGDTGPGDGIAGGTGDVSGESVVVNGNVSTLFQSGADEALTYSLTATGLPVLTSKGATVSYAVATVAGVDTLTASTEAGANVVFTLALTKATGAYTFTLVDQLDHADANAENDLSLLLGAAISAKDFDGDSVAALAADFVITVDDDSPIRTGVVGGGTVDEDGVLEGAANAGPGDGIAGGTGDVSGESVVVNGNVSTLFQSGADEALTYSLTATGLPVLTSKGATVSYAVATVAGVDTLTASTEAGANVVFTLALTKATGAYTFTLVDQLDHADANAENDLSLLLGAAISAKDFDGDSVAALAADFVITVDDDSPIRTGVVGGGTVDEDGVREAGNGDTGPGDGIAGGTGDVSGESVVVNGNVSTLFQSGADEALTYSLTATGLPVLTSAGVAVTYLVTTDAGVDTLTASAGVGNTVFTLALTKATGAYTFTLVDQLDHADANAENDLSLLLGAAISAKDFDGDSVAALAADFVIVVDDDSPVVTAKSNLVYANDRNPPPSGDPGGTGVFAFSIGADEHLAPYSATNSDFQSVALTGVTVGTNAITNKSVTWVSETLETAVFDFSFTYVSNNPTQGATTNAAGTLTFDKVADTYTVRLDNEIQSFSILKTSTAKGFQGYELNSTVQDNSGLPDVSVAKLADDFQVQFIGFQETGGNTPVGLTAVGSGAPTVFAEGELFAGPASTVSVSGIAAGVASDTLQPGEVMDLDFFTYDPKGDTTATPDATSRAIYLKFDGIGLGADKEDLVVVLKLIDPDDQSTTTRAFIVDNKDIIQLSYGGGTGIANPAEYGIVLDQNDGAVIFESNDFNFGSENYEIQGAQVLVSTQGLTGSGYNFNGFVASSNVAGDSDGATPSTSQQAFGDQNGEKSNQLDTIGGLAEAATWDGDVIKIVDIGFVASTTPDAHLTFDVAVKDADGDATASQTLDVTIVGGDGVTASADADTFVIGDTDVDGLLSMVMTVIDGGFVTGIDKLDFSVAGSGANYTENLVVAANLVEFTTAADNALNGTVKYYFGVVDGDGYLAMDADGAGITSIVELVGVINMEAADII